MINPASCITVLPLLLLLLLLLARHLPLQRGLLLPQQRQLR
jgi:hypothetical protein